MEEKNIILIMKKYLPYIDDAVLGKIAQEISALKEKTAEPNYIHFYNSLTIIERRALKILLELLNYNEGTISISKLIEETQISRAVITNLIVKIQRDKVMEVISKGVKGTYFKILVEELKEPIY